MFELGCSGRDGLAQRRVLPYEHASQGGRASVVQLNVQAFFSSRFFD